MTPNGLNRTQTAPLNIQNHSKQSNAQALDRPAKRQIVEWSERGHLGGSVLNFFIFPK